MKTIEQLTQELEAVKKERAWFKEQFDMLRNSYSIMVPQRDEAVRYLKRWLRGENRKQLQSEIEGFLYRLSSGETKVDDIHVADLMQQPDIKRETKAEIPSPTGVVHTVKCLNPFFADIAAGRKLFEVRKNDRNYGIGDELFIQEYDQYSQSYTGYNVPTIITYVLPGGQFGIENGYCVLGVAFKIDLPAPPES